MKRPESEVKVIVARCYKCNEMVFVAVEHLLDKQGDKELLDCVKSGCKVETIPLLDFRKIQMNKMCNTLCDNVAKTV